MSCCELFDLACQHLRRLAEMVLRPGPCDGSAGDEHHIVASGEDVRQCRELVPFNDKTLERTDPSGVDRRAELAGEDPLVRALDLEIERLPVAAHEIDRLTFIVEKDRSKRLGDIDQARSSLVAAAEFAPDDPQVLDLLAQIDSLPQR